LKQVFDVPERGDVIRVSLASLAVRGRDDRRFAFVVSPQAYNAKAGLALICPLTSRVTGYPFEVSLPSGLALAGVILADQVQSLDWRAHRAERVCSLPSSVIDEVLGKLRALTG